MATIRCPKCGSKSLTQLGNGQYACPYCGENFSIQEQVPTPQPMYSVSQYNQVEQKQDWQSAPQPMYSQAAQTPQPQNAVTTNKKKKDKNSAALLAIFLGSFGAQYFYLGSYFRAVAALLISWSYFPTIWGIIHGIILLCMSEEDFNKKYNQ